jgi:hypothetical protein
LYCIGKTNNGASPLTFTGTTLSSNPPGKIPALIVTAIIMPEIAKNSRCLWIIVLRQFLIKNKVDVAVKKIVIYFLFNCKQ